MDDKNFISSRLGIPVRKSTSPDSPESRGPKKEVILLGIVCSLLLYISLWQLLLAIVPENKKKLIYSTLGILSGLVLFILLDKYPKILG